MSELPKGWVKTLLVTTIDESRIGLVRSVAEQHDNQGYSYLRMQHYDLKGNWNFENLTKVIATPEELKIYQLREGDVIFNTRNSYELVGKVAFWNTHDSNYLYNNNLLRIRFNQYILPKWMYYQMSSPQFREKLQAVKSATTSVCAIYTKDLNTQRVLLPPLPEQHRIVAKLDRLLAHSRRARAELEQIPKLIERYKQAVLAAAFRGDLTRDWREESKTCWNEKDLLEFQQELNYNRKLLRGSRIAIGKAINEEEVLDLLPDTWLYGRLVDIADIKTGFAFKSEDFQKAGVKLARGINIAPNRFDWADVVYLSHQMAADYEEYLIEEGDILLAMDRPLISSGLKLARATASDAHSILVQRVARIRPRKWASTSFIWYLLSSDIFINHALSHATGSDLPHISGNDIALTPAPIPPLEEQVVIGEILEKALSLTKNTLSQIEKTGSLLDRLDQATLAKAFRGELVPQDPNDEPASALLERIHAERQEQPKKRGKRAGGKVDGAQLGLDGV